MSLKLTIGVFSGRAYLAAHMAADPRNTRISPCRGKFLRKRGKGTKKQCSIIQTYFEILTESTLHSRISPNLQSVIMDNLRIRTRCQSIFIHQICIKYLLHGLHGRLLRHGWLMVWGRFLCRYICLTKYLRRWSPAINNLHEILWTCGKKMVVSQFML